MEVGTGDGVFVLGNFDYDPENTRSTSVTENYTFSVTNGGSFGTFAIEQTTGIWTFTSNGTASFGDSVTIEVTGSGTRTATLGTAGYSDTDTVTINFVCFTSGSKIETANGPVEIENLSVGDMIATRSNGMQAIRWIGSRKIRARGDQAPIVFTKGALGNDRDLRVSPGHRMLITGWRAEVLFGKNEVLVAAKDLVNGDTIYRDEDVVVEYYHLLFDRHEIITAEGIPSESFHPALAGLDNLDIAARDEIFALFPELRDARSDLGGLAHLALSTAEAHLLH